MNTLCWVPQHADTNSISYLKNYLWRCKARDCLPAYASLFQRNGLYEAWSFFLLCRNPHLEHAICWGSFISRPDHFTPSQSQLLRHQWKEETQSASALHLHSFDRYKYLLTSLLCHYRIRRGTSVHSSRIWCCRSLQEMKSVNSCYLLAVNRFLRRWTTLTCSLAKGEICHSTVFANALHPQWIQYPQP